VHNDHAPAQIARTFSIGNCSFKIQVVQVINSFTCIWKKVFSRKKVDSTLLKALKTKNLNVIHTINDGQRNKCLLGLQSLLLHLQRPLKITAAVCFFLSILSTSAII